METSNQSDLNDGASEIADVENEHSCLLSKLIYKQLELEANSKFAKNFDEIDQENETYTHPDAPPHKLSDIIRKKLHIHNNDEIEEEEEASDDDLTPSTQTHLLSERLIDLCPQIFRSGDSSNL